LTSTSSAGKTTIATQLDKSYSYKQIAYDDLSTNEKINEVATQTLRENKNFVIDTIYPNLDEVHSTIVNESNVYKVLIYTDIEDLGRNIENRYKKGLEELKNNKEKLGEYARGIFVFDQFLSFYKNHQIIVLILSLKKN